MAQQSSRAKVIIVDDHAIVRQGLAELINDQPDLVACGEADSPPTALKVIADCKPDVAIIDITLSGGDGIELCRQIHDRWPDLPILVLSMHDEALYAERVLRAGAMGYLAKRSAPEALIEAVNALMRGERYVDAQTAQALAVAQVDGEASPADLLSEREFSVFIQLARGMSVAQIAEALSLSPSTVGTHLYHVKQKLGASNQSELTLVALRWGLIQA